MVDSVTQKSVSGVLAISKQEVVWPQLVSYFDLSNSQGQAIRPSSCWLTSDLVR